MGQFDSRLHVLVTGGAGYIGSVASTALLSAGYRVRVVDRLMHGGFPLLGMFRPEFSFVNGDIRDAAVVDRVLDGIDAVVHLAAIVGDPACARQPDLAWQTNHDAAIQVYESAKRKGIRKFIFASTCSNYGRMKDPTSYVDENSTLAPVSLYAESKVAVEKKLFCEHQDRGPSTTVLRFATIFGLSPRMRFDLTVNEFVMEALTKRKLVIFGEQFWRPYVHVRDAARAIKLVIESDERKIASRVFNVGDTNQNYQKKGIVDLVLAQVPHKVEIQFVRKQEDPRDYKVSFERINKELGFEITTTVEGGVAEVVKAISSGIFSDLNDPRYRN